ncbi:hypothetical protein SB758_37370, partial [Burkholderia sp. SIMBA_013]
RAAHAGTAHDLVRIRENPYQYFLRIANYRSQARKERVTQRKQAAIEFCKHTGQLVALFRCLKKRVFMKKLLALASAIAVAAALGGCC